jgi:hypothetical protein
MSRVAGPPGKPARGVSHGLLSLALGSRADEPPIRAARAAVAAHDRHAIAHVGDQEFDHVWKALELCTAGERHFNELESRYRTLASTWLLAAFGGAGFVVSSNSLALPFDRALIVAALGLAAVVGVVMLWLVDLLVYHQLLDACFNEACALESTFPWLPPVRQRQIASQVHGSATARVVRFYQAGIAVLGLMLVAVPLTVYAEQAGWLLAVIVAVLAVSSTTALALYVGWATSAAHSGADRS